jgi:hypothetical protein
MTTIRPELSERSLDVSPATFPSLSALDLERHVSVPEAARLKGVSPDTFRRHYSHLVRRLSPRRCAVKLRDLLSQEI